MQNKSALIAALALLLVLSGCTAPGGGSGRSTWVMGWQYLPTLALAIGGFLLAIGWMAASFLADEQMKAWTKKEVGQLFYSAIILLVAAALIGSMDGWVKVISLAGAPAWQNYVNTMVCCDPAVSTCVASTALQGNRPCHIALASDYLQILYDSGRMSAQSSLFLYWIYSFFHNLTFGVTIQAMIELFSVYFRPFAGLAIPADYFAVMFDLTVKTMMFARVQQLFFEYVWYSFFPLMLSMGLVLRIFYFTRKLGGLLVALALCSYIVLPMFYVLGNAILFGFMGGWTTPGSFGVDFDQANSFLPGTSGTIDTQGRTQNQLFSEPANVLDICGTSGLAQRQEHEGMINNIIGQWDVLRDNNWYKGFLSTIAGKGFAPEGHIGTLASLMIFSLVIPFLGLMTMLAAFKYFSPLIGGDVEISVLSRLI